MNDRKIRGRMVELSLTQRDIAKKLGISTGSFANKLNGRSQFTIQEAFNLCSILDFQNPTEIFFADSGSDSHQGGADGTETA